jgi:hypothetical protein
VGKRVRALIVGDVTVENRVLDNGAALESHVSTVVNVPTGNVREHPTTESRRVAQFSMGTELSLTGMNKLSDGIWFRISQGEITGWVHESVIDVPAPEQLMRLPFVGEPSLQPMQAFNVTLRPPVSSCLQSPPMLILQAEQGSAVLFINGESFTINSAAILTLVHRDGTDWLQVVALGGAVTIEHTIISPNQIAVRPLNPDLSTYSNDWTVPQRMAVSDLAGLSSVTALRDLLPVALELPTEEDLTAPQFVCPNNSNWLTSPSGVTATTTFTWNPIPGADYYVVGVLKAQGGESLYRSGQLSGTSVTGNINMSVAPGDYQVDWYVQAYTASGQMFCSGSRRVLRGA